MFLAVERLDCQTNAMGFLLGYIPKEETINMQCISHFRPVRIDTRGMQGWGEYVDCTQVFFSNGDYLYVYEEYGDFYDTVTGAKE